MGIVSGQPKQHCRVVQCIIRKNLLFTLWGDNGGECSRFALLPALFYAAQAAHGITDIEQVKRNFLARFTVTWDDFMAA